MGVSNGSGTNTLARWLPLSGVVFVVLTIVAVVVVGGNTPDDNASASHVISFYGSHQNSEAVAAFLLAASAPFATFFGIYLATVFTHAAPGPRFAQYLLIAGAAVTTVVWILAAFIHFALADGADHLTPSVMQGLNMLDSDSWIAFNSGLGLFMLAAAFVLIPTSAGFRRLGWVALLLGIALFIPYADFIALLLTGVWILATSIMLTRKAPAAIPLTAV